MRSHATVIAISVLAVGIGINTAIFSVINTVLLQPLPYPEPDRLLSISRTARGLRGPASIQKFTLWRERSTTLDEICAYDFAGAGLNLSGGDTPELVQGIRVSISRRRTADSLPGSFARPSPGRPRHAAQRQNSRDGIRVFSSGKNARNH